MAKTQLLRSLPWLLGLCSAISTVVNLSLLEKEFLKKNSLTNWYHDRSSAIESTSDYLAIYLDNGYSDEEEYQTTKTTTSSEPSSAAASQKNRISPIDNSNAGTEVLQKTKRKKRKDNKLRRKPEQQQVQILKATTNTDGVHPIDEFIERETTEGSSLQILLSKLKTFSQPEAYGDAIDDAEAETARCARYGFEYNPAITKRRRVFMGSLIADDSWHVIATHAAEAYGLYHTVALIESNTTQTMTVRKTRFDEGSLNYRMMQSGIFGPKTDVHVDFRVDAGKDVPKMDAFYRENLQRSYITQRWKDAGMQPDDIGLICDIDEVFTRDFLLALQTCDVPQFRPGQDCGRNAVTGQGLRFEIAPDSMDTGSYYTHPQALIGECIEKIGDTNVHKPGGRGSKKSSGLIGKRAFEWHAEGTDMYPLWEPWDFRRAGGQNKMLGEGNLHTAYHFHNFFDSFEVFKNKYKTFAHGDGKTEIPISKIGHVAPAIKAIKEQHENPTRFDTFERTKPLLLEDLYSYRKARMGELMVEVEAEEKREQMMIAERESNEIEVAI